VKLRKKWKCKEINEGRKEGRINNNKRKPEREEERK
jgi:hypothetical protein